MEYLRKNSAEDSLRLFFIMNLAPLLKGMKASCILVVPTKNLDKIQEEIKDTNLLFRILHTEGVKTVVMLYRKKQLQQYLKRENVEQFLAKYGYTDMELAESLELLRERVASFYAKEESFPHEIGIFLGYPVEDVEGFIANKGRNCLMDGYWKVYSNVEQAREMFRQFDLVKIGVAKELLSGKMLCEIAN